MNFNPIGFIETCFTEKFGVPRQSLMVKNARGTIRLDSQFDAKSVLHLEGFSHLWLIYLFHKGQNDNHPSAWTPTIAPPRIDAPKKVGVFASRSPHRPNPIGMSAVKLESISNDDGRIVIEVSGVDLLDQTPILDIKPYIPYADAITSATSGWIQNEISRYTVAILPESGSEMLTEDELELIREVLEWDPRPRSQREHDPIESTKSLGRRFAFRLGDHDIHWEIAPEKTIRVIKIRKLK